MESAFLIVLLVLACVTVVGRYPLFATGGHRLVVTSRPVVSTPHFFVCTHDYEHADLLVVLAEIERMFTGTGMRARMVLADKPWNKAFNAVLNRNANALYTTVGTTRRIVEALSHESVFIFLYRANPGTGIHYVLREFTGPVYTMRITSRHAPIEDHSPSAALRRSTGALFYVRYAHYGLARLHDRLTARDGMQLVKDHLYPTRATHACPARPRSRLRVIASVDGRRDEEWQRTM